MALILTHTRVKDVGVIIIALMKDRKSGSRMRLRSNVWEVQELKFELGLCACNHHVILGRARTGGWYGREMEGVWGPDHAGHMFSKLKIRAGS